MAEVTLRSMGEMSILLLESVRKEVAHRKGVMDEAAKIVQAEAKAIIGTYQRDNTGPFEPWAELADSTKADRVRLGFTENDPLERTGDLRDSVERVATAEEAAVGSDEDKAVWLEMGTIHMPPRSVFGISAVHKGEDVANLIGGDIVRNLFGGTGTRRF